ncbi:hypothetical protein AB0896_16350 [Streptomyces parvulus]|uniref:hypothetical protein n=1 Tax=Streptomyces TaxID=1883 RepID=UPI001C1E2055|nr:hypothetical protein [Streptomyces sp. A108]MBU6530975.1 hypothetical protein [Streptomyces sp. A108]
MEERDTIADRWAEHLWIDYLVAALILGVHVLVIRATESGDWLSWIDSSQRTGLYAAAAGVVSAIGGLSAIAISIYTAANGERLRAVRRHHQDDLRRSWRSLLCSTALVCTLLLSALSLDRDKDPVSARFIFEFAMSFAALRFSRLIWLFDSMMRVSDADSAEPDPVATPVRDPDWLRRRQNTP